MKHFFSKKGINGNITNNGKFSEGFQFEFLDDTRINPPWLSLSSLVTVQLSLLFIDLFIVYQIESNTTPS